MSSTAAADRPLSGRRILVTRAAEAGDRFGDLLRERGAEVVAIPLIRFVSPRSEAPLDQAASRLETFDWILFTSATAVEWFLRGLAGRGVPRSRWSGIPVAAVGEKTAGSLRREGVRVDLVPPTFQAEGLLERLDASRVKGKRILFPRAEEARELLVEELERRGAEVALVPVYRTARAEESRAPLREALAGRRIDFVTFTAASTVRHFVELVGEASLPELMRGVRVGCLGPITAEAARSRGLFPDVVPERSTMEDFAAAIVAACRAGEEGAGRS